uniref:Uncharacterized protein n=1 Tax=Manihot esculenta TaxID=3983 RepID=A0A2C9W500_MANES
MQCLYGLNHQQEGTYRTYNQRKAIMHSITNRSLSS